MIDTAVLRNRIEPLGRFDCYSGLWVLCAEWKCRLTCGTLIVSPEFISDGASIPRLLWSAVGPRFSADTFPAALAHDCLYASELVSREQADREFHRLLRAHGVCRFRAWLYLRAVRNCGGRVWRRHTPETIAAARLLVRIEGVQ